MTPIQYCYEKMTAHGSPVYYSLKKIPAEKRDAIVAISAFYQEIEEILLESIDPNLTYEKLNWWRSEISKLTNSSPTHPIALALQKTMDYSLLNRLYAIVDGLEEKMNIAPFESFESVVVHFMRTAGERELLILEMLGFSKKIPVELIYQLTIVVELTHYIQHLRRFVKCGLLYFPMDEMNKYHVTNELLKSDKTSQEIINLLQYQAEKIESAYQKSCETITPEIREMLVHLLARCDIAQATLKEIQNSNFAVLENYIQLTPLKMWWIAYRA